MSSGSLHAGCTDVNSSQELFLNFIEFSPYSGCRVRRSFSLGVEHHSEWSWAGEGKWGWDTKWSFLAAASFSVVWDSVHAHHIVSLSAETSFVQRPPALEVSVLIYIFWFYIYTKFGVSNHIRGVRFSMQDPSLNTPHWLAGLLDWRVFTR